MAAYEYDIGIIGAGAAGLTIASGAAQLGAKTLLIEKEGELGGDCLHFGCVPSKTLIKTARVYHSMKNAVVYGLPTVERPPVNYRDVANRIRSVIDIIQKHDSEERFCDLGAKVDHGSPTFLDPHSIDLNGQTHSAKTWVIATGSSPVVPPIPGLADTPHLTNRDIFSLDRLPESMVVLGGGPIGVEMSQAFARLGTQVSLVDRADQILGKEDKAMADMVMEALASEGVAFHLESAIGSVRDAGDAREVVIRTKAGETVNLRASAILVAMGRSANVQDLGLEDIGVAFDRRGVTVDNRLRTSHKHIYAAGDVNGTYQFTHAAGYEGGIVVSNVVFHLPRKTDYTYLPWCTYTDPELASIGMNERSARQAGIDCSVWVEEFGQNDRSLAEGYHVGRLQMVLDEKEKPIGVQIFGPKAGELLGEWVAVLNGNVRLSTLASAVHPYPTLGEINKKVAGALYSDKMFSGKVKKGLKLFFQLKGRACGWEPDPPAP